MAKKNEQNELKTYRQVPFNATLIEVGNEEGGAYNIINVFTPDDGKAVYIVDDLPEGDIKLETPGQMDGAVVTIKHSL